MTAAISPTERRRLGYRPELDGLRAVAVLMVITAHYLGWAGAGRGGVILFFVLSGFLITTVLKEEHAMTGRLDVRAFYARRVRRLVPALVLMLVVVGLIALASGARQQVPGLVLSFTYLANWAQQLGIDMGVLGHMWSLGVEEQFYLALPLALLGAHRLPLIAWAAAAGLVIVTLVAVQPGFGAILVGCGIAQLRWRRAMRVPDRYLVLAVSALIGLSFVDDFGRWSSPAFLVTGVLGAAIIVWALQAPRSVLSWRPITYLGRISYGIYLWHLPLGLLLLEPLRASGLPPAISLLLIAGLTILIAACSYRLVERPLMTGAQLPLAQLRNVLRGPKREATAPIAQ